MKRIRFIINILIVLLLLAMSVQTIYDVYRYSIILTIQHYLGISFTIITLTCIFFNKNVFTLLLGVNLLIGNFCGLTVMTFLCTSAFLVGKIPLYWGQEFYTMLLIIYFLFNKDFYTGILSMRYWLGFLTRSEDIKMEIVVIRPPDNENN